MQVLYAPREATLEQRLLDELSIQEPWALIERFSTLVRESGSEDERIAAQYIVDRLTALGIPYTVYEPELFISVPVSARLEVGGRNLRAKTPAFSASTGPEGRQGTVVYVPGRTPSEVQRLFHFDPEGQVDVRGKIVLTEGFGFPGAVRHFEEQGAIGQIYINPGVDIHWGICTTIWGAPDLDNYRDQPRTPVIAINRPDGEALVAQVTQEPTQVTLYTDLKEGWFPCPLVVAEIQGTQEPERFVLVHGHYDSWDVGVGDNAVGDATLLELARVFHRHRDGLARSLRIAWWPAHSTGRYGGSTWYADTFGLELDRNCIAQVNIDSPGCRWATEYYDISWMTEAEDFCVQAIRDATGQPAQGERPHQAGDYSFNNIGISGFFMLLSTMPRELLQEKGYYPVGGCGGNIAWHTEHDRLEIADRDNLMRDLRVYVTTLHRVLNNPLHPFDFRKLGREFHETLSRYAEAAGDAVDFGPAFRALGRLQGELAELYALAPELSRQAVTDPRVRAFNDALLELGRLLVPINYTRRGRFRTEPALPIPPLPDLAPATELPRAEGHLYRVLQTHLLRGVNRVAWTFERAAEVAQMARERVNRASAS